MKYQSLLPFLSVLAAAAPLEERSAPLALNKIPAGVYIEPSIAKSSPPEAQVVVMKYGPFKVPANGMIENSKLPTQVASPCTNCYITAMEADMKYADGREANIDSGAWLHHMVLYNSLGIVGKKDIVCTGSMEAVRAGVPTAIFGYPHRIFASGNERATVRINGKYKAGIPMDMGDGIFLLYDLVNQANKDAEYYIHMKYEYVPQSTPGYKKAEMIWMDITGCGNSDAPAQVGNYELKSSGWSSKISGKLLATLGHTHDGGAFTTVYLNGKPICKSTQFYNTKPGYQDTGMGGGMMNMGGMRNVDGVEMGPDNTHISDITSCTDFGRVNLGDNWVIGATYNTSAHGLQRAMEKGETGWAPIMGISPIYVLPDN